MTAHKNKPGLCLKERVRAKEITVHEAIDLLKEREPKLYSQTATYKWLSKRLK